MDEEEEKQKILLSLNIRPGTYRSQRLKVKTKKEYINILLSYFGYKDICVNEKTECEILLSKIYYCCYYKRIDLLYEFIKILDNKIAE